MSFHKSQTTMGKTKSKETRTFASIAAAAASLGVSDSILKQAKRLGCAAFHASGRVDGATVVKFIAEHGKEIAGGGIALRDQKLSEEIRKLRVKNDRDEGKLILVDSVKACVSRVLARVDQILEQKLSNEYPAAVAGLDVPQSRIYGKRLGDQIRVEFQGLKEEWK